MSEAKRPRLGGAVDSVEVDSLAGLVDILCAQSPAAAARSWRMALLAMMLPDLSPALDSSKCMMMALVHDLATALQYAPPGEQQQETTPPVVGVAEDAPAGAVASREGGAAMLKLRDTKLKGMESSASRVYELWEEYDAAKTPEAKAVRDLAAVAAAVRGNRQQCSEGGTELSPSPALAATCSTPACKQLLAEIKRRREDAAPAGTAVSPVQQGESERAAPRAPPPGVSQRTSMPLPTPQLKPPPGGTKPQPQPIQPPLRQQPAPGPPPTLQRLTVDNAHVGSILGKGGCNISRVRATSGAQVKIHEAAPGSTVRLIEITGTLATVESAKAMIQALMSSDTSSGGGQFAAAAAPAVGYGAAAFPHAGYGAIYGQQTHQQAAWAQYYAAQAAQQQQQHYQQPWGGPTVHSNN